MTVKDKKRGRPSGKNNLSQSSIIDQAKQLMAEQGKVPSIRALATSLDVDAMAIYHYFKNKDALLEAITVSLIEEIDGLTLDVDWQTGLERLCLNYLNLLNQYPGLLETLLSMKSAGLATVFQQHFEEVIAPLELTEAQTHNAISLLVDYLHGFALAMQCNKGTQQALSVEMIAGPLTLIKQALIHESQTS